MTNFSLLPNKKMAGDLRTFKKKKKILQNRSTSSLFFKTILQLMIQPLKLAAQFATLRIMNICLPNTLSHVQRVSQPCSNEQKLYSPRCSFGRAIALSSAILQTCTSHFLFLKRKKEKTTSLFFQKQNEKCHSIECLQNEFLRALASLLEEIIQKMYHFEFHTWLSTFSSL